MKVSNLVKAARRVDERVQRSLFPDQRRILINARTSMNFATLAPIVETLQRDPRIEIFLTASENPEQVEEIYKDARAPYRIISASAARFRRFDVYLAADFLWVSLPRGTSRIQTFHGVAGKYRKIYDSPDQSVREWDRLFFINRRRMQHFIDSKAIDADSPAACLIGMPKLDCLVDGSLNREEVLRSLELDPSKQTVLYAPTWSPYSSVCVMGEELVRRLGEFGYNVIVKLHDRSRDLLYANSGGVDWGDRLQPILREIGGKLFTSSNSSPCLAASDLLITDHSSVGFEYLILDRPLVRIHLPELIANTDIEPAYVAMMASASYSCFTLDDVFLTIEAAFRNPSEHAENRRLVAEELFYKPGTATTRAVAELYKVMGLEPLEVLPSRIIDVT